MPTQTTNSEWIYNFRELEQKFKINKDSETINKLFSRYSIITKAWDDKSNTEWLCRHYVAAKLIMAATLNINSIE